MIQLSTQKTSGDDPAGTGTWSSGMEVELPTRSGSSRLHRDPGSLGRPRLVGTLQGRWRHRVTVLVGGPGFGKSTLLVDALVENHLAAQGEDVWIGVEPGDADGDGLARAVATALGQGGGDEPADPVTLADLVERRSPDEVCLVFDDVQRLPAGSAGATWLAQLVERLPANGHVVLASRVEPPVPLARLRTQGAVLRLGHDELLFDDDELAAFATLRGVDAGRLATTGGWPALAELTASGDADVATDFLWEEVLDPLGPERRHVLAVVCDLGGADDELASAALDAPVELSTALRGVPLVQVEADSWRVPHRLWRDAPGLSLTPDEHLQLCHRAVPHLAGRDRFDDAFRLLSEATLWDLAPAVLRDACLATDRLGADRLGRWLSLCPDEVRASPAGRLATGLQAAVFAPEDAAEPLREAATRCREAGDVDAELVAIGQLGRLAWFRQGPAVYGEELAPRLGELAAAGHPRAQGLAAFCRATLADLAGDDAQVLAELSGIETGALDPKWEAMATWLCGVVRLGLGDADAAGELVERLTPTTDPTLQTVLHGLRLRACWCQGRIDEVLDETPALLAGVRATGVASGLHIALTSASLMFSYVGDLAAARRHLDDALGTASPSSPSSPSSSTPPPSPNRPAPVRAALARAALDLAEGDEERAAATLREAIDVHGLDRGIHRRGWRHTLPLSYVLVPETRDHWDQLVLHGYQRTARELAAAVVSLREGRGGPDLADLDVPPPGMVRTALHHRFAAELAVGLSAADRPEGTALLEAIGPVGRSVVRSAAATRSRLAKPAKALLSVVPAPPPHPLYLALLGPLELRRDGVQGDEVTNTDLRRKRVRELLAFLVAHRSTTRMAIAAALWPGLDERTASNNLGVTLCYLLRALEPWRPPGEPTYLVRLDGQRVKLVTGPQLGVDLDDFDDQLTAAARAEASGVPSVALEHLLAAVDLYRDTLCADLPDSSWMMLHREQCTSRFVRAATRAGQLLLGRGETERAETVARRAVDVDPLAEPAHAVLVAASLARDDASAARRQLQHCLTTLADHGVKPSPATHKLRRQLRLL